MPQFIRVLLALVASQIMPASISADEPRPTVAEVRLLLGADEQPHYQRAQEELVKFGARALPACEVILADHESKSPELIGAMHLSRDILIKDAKIDRTRVLDCSVRLFNHDRAIVRRVALQVLADIGSERDTAPILAMLSDEDNAVRREAAKTLSEIGGKRDLVAMDIWLKTGNYRNDVFHLNHVKKCRDALEKRLKEAEKNKKK